MPGAVLRRTLTVAVVLAQLLGASRAHAQGPVTTPAGSSLNLEGALGGGWESNSLVNSATAASQAPLFQGSNTNVSGNARLVYLVPHRRYSFGATFGSTFRLYRSPVGNVIPLSHAAAAGLTVALSPRLAARVDGSASYAPRYSLNVFPGAASAGLGQTTAPPIDYALSETRVLNYGTAASLAYSPTKYSTIDARATLGYSTLPGQSTTYRHETAGLNFRRLLTQHLGLRIG